MAYCYSLEKDECINKFLDNIEKSINPTPFELLKQYISNSARYMMCEKFEAGENSSNKSLSSFSPLSTFFLSSQLFSSFLLCKSKIKPLPYKE